MNHFESGRQKREFSICQHSNLRKEREDEEGWVGVGEEKEEEEEEKEEEDDDKRAVSSIKT